MRQARDYLERGQSGDAERLLRRVVAVDARNREALEQLVMICLQTGRPDTAEKLLRRLSDYYPNEPLYCYRLATLLSRLGRGAEAITCYQRLLATRPGLNNSRYNLARLLKQEGRPEEALEEYRRCLEGGGERPEDVLSNISVIQTELHRHTEARRSLQAALQHNPDYIPALYNLAQLEEDEGDWPEAAATYRRILAQEPLHPRALARLANGERCPDAADPRLDRMRAALSTDGLTAIDREDLLYALGKAHDDCEDYDKAFAYYQQANRLSAERCGAYDRVAQERDTQALIAACGSDWLSGVEPVSDAPLVFICGMFRSGTTLLEQMLAAHPALTAGGEIDFFQRRIDPFPGGLLRLDHAQRAALGGAYMDYLSRYFPAGARVTNKRPDNLLCLGLLRGLFPNARFVNIRRDPLDNCLSLYFQPLEPGQRYANDLLDAGHFYLQYLRLLAHWRGLLGDSLLDIHYEDVIENPRQTVGRALSLLHLEWDEKCLSFYRTANRVRTASVHQVREPLYRRSSGRWRNYGAHMEKLREYLGSS